MCLYLPWLSLQQRVFMISKSWTLEYIVVTVIISVCMGLKIGTKEGSKRDPVVIQWLVLWKGGGVLGQAWSHGEMQTLLRDGRWEERGNWIKLYCRVLYYIVLYCRVCKYVHYFFIRIWYFGLRLFKNVIFNHINNWNEVTLKHCKYLTHNVYIQ